MKINFGSQLYLRGNLNSAKFPVFFEPYLSKKVSFSYWAKLANQVSSSLWALWFLISIIPFPRAMELLLLGRTASLCLEVLMLADSSIWPQVWIDGWMSAFCCFAPNQLGNCFQPYHGRYPVLLGYATLCLFSIILLTKPFLIPYLAEPKHRKLGGCKLHRSSKGCWELVKYSSRPSSQEFPRIALSSKCLGGP